MRDEDRTKEEVVNESVMLRGEINALKNELEIKKQESDRCKGLEYQQLISIFDTIDVPIYVVDPQTYEVLYINQTIKNMLGDVVGKKCYDAFQALEFPCSFCTNEHIFGDNVGRTYIWDFQNRFNSRWYHCVDKAIQWPDGRTVRYEIAIDITDRKKMEEALHESKSKSLALINAIPDLMFHLRRDGTFLNYKAARREMLLVDPDEFLGKKTYDVLPPELAQLTMEHINQVAATDKIEIYEYQLHMRGGELRYFECRMVACGDDEVVAIVRDITERKKMEEALSKSKRLLERAFYNLRDAVLLCDVELTKIVDCNPAASKVFGYIRDMIVGQKMSSLFVDTEEFAAFKKQLNIAVDNKGLMSNVDFKMKHQDGTVFPSKHDAMLLEDEKGNQIG